MKKYNIREFEIEKIPRSCTWIVIGRPGVGKTSLEENLMFFNRHKYAVGKAFIGDNPDARKTFSNILKPLYVCDGYDKEELERYVKRQKEMANKYGRNSDNAAAVLLFDDVVEDSKIFKDPLFNGLFKVGSRHWNQMVILGTQYVVDFPTQMRRSASFIALFNEPSPEEIKKLWKYFGGGTSIKEFTAIMNSVTGNHRCLIISNREDSTNIEDKFFWYKTKIQPEVPRSGAWRLGCPEYRHWGEERYNKKYTPDF